MNKKISKKDNTGSSIAKLLVQSGCISVNFEKPYTFVSGIQSPIYIDLRKLISKPKVRKEITNAFSKILKGIKVNVFVGIATGSIAYAAWLAEAKKQPMMYVRKQEKNHGTRMLIEGEVNKSGAGVLVEDVVTTGESSLKSVDILKNEGYKIPHCICIFSYNPKETGQKFLKKGVSLHYLTSLELVLLELLKSKAINGNQLEKIKKIFIN